MLKLIIRAFNGANNIGFDDGFQNYVPKLLGLPHINVGDFQEICDEDWARFHLKLAVFWC